MDICTIYTAISIYLLISTFLLLIIDLGFSIQKEIFLSRGRQPCILAIADPALLGLVRTRTDGLDLFGFEVFDWLVDGLLESDDFLSLIF